MRFNFTEFLNNLDKQKIILILIVSAVLVYVDFAYLMKAQFDGLKKSDPQIIKLKKEIEVLNKDIANARALQQVQSVAVKETASSKKIISSDEVPSLMENITKLARKYGISIMQISSAKIKDAAKAATTVKDAKPESGDTYSTVSISIEVSCDYHALGGFIGELNQLQAIVAVSEMIITPGGEDTVKQNVSLELKTYVKK